MSEYQDIIIAVHGIGEQSRNVTVRSVANRLAQSPALYQGLPFAPVAPQPLGYFHTNVHGAVHVLPLDRFSDPSHTLAKTGFCEVFWADIPQEVDREGRTLEEIKAWGRTVVARARAICEQARLANPKKKIVPPDFGLAAEVLDEIIDTLHVVENLLFLAEKAGVVKFDLQKVLREYLGDVQVMTEFALFRCDIIGRFHRAMEQVHTAFPKARLHIVSHSEGTVVSFIGLLHALHGEQVRPATDPDGPKVESGTTPPAWLKQVHGYMTFGSPIDKHLLLWPELFASFNFSSSIELLKPDSIHWRNYYDRSDPIGFELDTARRWLRSKNCRVFEFRDEHDIGFYRYPVPGKAHNDYWLDAEVFEHFIRDVMVQPRPKEVVKPASRPGMSFLSGFVPYALSALILFAGVLLLYRGVKLYIQPPLDPMQNFARYMTVGTFPLDTGGGWTIALNALCVTALIGGTTLFARMPRLQRRSRGLAWGAVAFVIGCAAYYFGLQDKSREAIGSIFGSYGLNPTLGVIACALAVAGFGMLALWPPKKVPGRPFLSRRTRWFRTGMRPLLCAGVVLIALVIGFQMRQPKSGLSGEEYDQMMRSYLQANTNNAILSPSLLPVTADPTEYQRVNWNTDDPAVLVAKGKADTVSHLVEVKPSLWPVLLAGAAFLYLWWLAALIFDLVYVWHRYVRGSVFLERLDEWRHPEQGSCPRGANKKPSPPVEPKAA